MSETAGHGGKAPDAGRSRDRGQTNGDDQRHETEMERLDRNYGELLQELRVAQTGVQLLVAFLLTIAFSPRFAETTPFQRAVYFATLMLAVTATVLLIAPVSHHRIVFRHRRKRELVRTANNEALTGLFLLALALLGAVLLITDLLFNGIAVAVPVAAVAVLFGIYWVALPVRDRSRPPA